RSPDIGTIERKRFMFHVSCFSCHSVVIQLSFGGHSVVYPVKFGVAEYFTGGLRTIKPEILSNNFGYLFCRIIKFHKIL
ncbi:MAG: hypothetical protein ACLFT4_01865, partial [Bacteroidales bacterium]